MRMIRVFHPSPHPNTGNYYYTPPVLLNGSLLYNPGHKYNVLAKYISFYSQVVFYEIK